MNPILVLVLRVLLLLLAYTFVGWLAHSMFTDLRKSSGKSGPVSFPLITLTSELDEASNPRQFSNSQLTIGRDPVNDFPIDHPTISLRHCRLSFHNKQWWVEDLDSTNGSFLNDSQIDSPTVLTDGDELRLGEIYIKININ
ncbi:MAG: FHA domain-containing protein [Anaerolineaceae bacterium]|nr:FHA domain-containing protein [Anaerolineaceae bacterium]